MTVRLERTALDVGRARSRKSERFTFARGWTTPAPALPR